MSDSGGTSQAEQDRLRALAEMAARIREDRARGRRRWRGAAEALRWMCTVREARSAPRALQFRRDSSGPPSVEAIESTERALAAVYAAVKHATLDDQERHPEKPAPISEWVAAAYLGAGRVRGYSDAQIAERSTGWTEGEVQSRMHRMLRVVREHLVEHGWLEERERSVAGGAT